MALANPVPGVIQANNEVWKGTPTFRVTSTFQQHAASGRALGIDFGNGRQGDVVRAMDAGTVTLAGMLGAANVVRVRHANGYTSGYAHLATIGVRVGQVVTRGQPLGTVGMTGADAPHLHGGYTNPAGAEVDFWPLLEQNQEEPVPVIPAANFSHVINRKSSLKASSGLRANPSGAGSSTVLRTFPAGTIFFPVVKVTYPTAADWYGTWLPDDAPAGQTFGYFVETACNPLEVNEAGADTTAAYNAGVAAAAAKATEAKK